ncbi:hypothetical protein MLAC_10590 [Mycobacterium lacus]|uniref:AMP-dependent synthetase/ligase domain-containing protein n=1 Tax=Mycobacterium lacus TaxID=169765 RepID=A0A7I7NGL8_9MYCO|nr:hypothetical protein MLAC_10590 [Mycobacterium lacus]
MSGPPGPTDFGVDRFTVPAVLDRRAEQYPDCVMMSIAGADVTFEQMRQRSRAAARMLAELGVGSGDCVALYTATCPEWVYFWLGEARIGALSAAVNAADKGDFLLHNLRVARAKVVVTDAERRPRVEEIAGQLDAATDVLVQDDSLSSTLARGGDGPDNPTGPDELGSLFFTSGTTGPSKAVATTWHYLFTVAATVASAWEFGPGEVVWSAMPLFHLSAAPTVLAPMLVGGTTVLAEAFHPTRCGTTCAPTAPSASPAHGRWFRCCRTCPRIRATRSCRCGSSPRRPSTQRPTATSRSGMAVASSRCTG